MKTYFALHCPEDLEVKKAPCFHEPYILLGGDSKQTSKIYSVSEGVECDGENGVER